MIELIAIVITLTGVGGDLHSAEARVIGTFEKPEDCYLEGLMMKTDPEEELRLYRQGLLLVFTCRDRRPLTGSS